MFLLLAGVLLVTGASIAGVVQATREAATTTSERVRRTTRTVATAPLPGDPIPPGPVEPPEPENQEPVVRATHVEAPALDAEERYPDLFEDEEQPEPGGRGRRAVARAGPEVAAARAGGGRAAAGAVTPMGNRRSAVTEADDYDYRLPKPSFLKRSNGAQKVDTKGIERTGAQLTEALSHFNVEARVIGTVTGPHVTRYELRMAPGIKMSKVAQLKDDLAYALAAEQVRILAPIPASRRSAWRCPTGCARWCTSATSSRTPKGWSPLSVWLGKDIAGKAIGTDLAKQPHI